MTFTEIVAPVGSAPVAQAPLARAVFVDKDGTLVEDVPHNVDPSLLRFTAGAVEGLRLLSAHDFQIIVVTNQPGIAMSLFDRAALVRLQARLTEMLAQEGVTLNGFYACPHPASTNRVMNCLCRKPAPGLLYQAARARRLDLSRSWMVGDILDDVEAGQRAGCRSVLLDVGHETVWRLSPLRRPQFRAPDVLSAARFIVSQD